MFGRCPWLCVPPPLRRRCDVARSPSKGVALQCPPHKYQRRVPCHKRGWGDAAAGFSSGPARGQPKVDSCVHQAPKSGKGWRPSSSGESRLRADGPCSYVPHALFEAGVSFTQFDLELFWDRLQISMEIVAMARSYKTFVADCRQDPQCVAHPEFVPHFFVGLRYGRPNLVRLSALPRGRRLELLATCPKPPKRGRAETLPKLL